MANTALIPALFGVTLVVVLIIAAIGFALFMRKRRNRHPMDTPEGKAIDRQHDQAAKDARR